ncbi:protein translocase subunit SecF [Candidatus Methylomirabilis limnetica]|uniref:Protein-export membrane protein SecF n=1 Tax=Candidatus Methylomirabilis limnetica TaxID=2033718 RepID=A0A2T4TYE6_9BACT|nr:protein translocase subunit SecF [Candidatus Methylomirabilis limnetica]PTL36133.1 protein translocase subunit SecF [Candidatus Methylomirabilis limnetica]
MMEILGKTKVDFVAWRRTAFTVSAVLCLLGIVSIIQIGRGAANLGIDFAGGTSVQLKFSKPVDLGRVRTLLAESGLKDSEPQQFAGGDRIMVRLKRAEGSQAGMAQRVQDIFSKGLPDNPFVVEGTNEVGPAIGKDLQKAALWAIAFSMIGIIAYIAWRFEFKFGIAAAIATLHDVLAVLGFFYVLNGEITLLIITALLTLAGYSLTDTVVVFDRIRENLQGRRKESLGDVINMSINEVLSRTIVTSLTVLLVLLALFMLGGEVLHDFSLALIAGVCVGTYSSWFVASPIVYEWRTWERSKLKAPVKAKVKG